MGRRARSIDRDLEILEDLRKTWEVTLEIAIESEITWKNGARSVYFRDPAGNSLEFAEPKLWGYNLDESIK